MKKTTAGIVIFGLLFAAVWYNKNKSANGSVVIDIPPGIIPEPTKEENGGGGIVIPL